MKKKKRIIKTRKKTRPKRRILYNAKIDRFFYEDNGKFVKNLKALLDRSLKRARQEALKKGTAKRYLSKVKKYRRKKRTPLDPDEGYLQSFGIKKNPVDMSISEYLEMLIEENAEWMDEEVHY